jgi:hypothetical protein
LFLFSYGVINILTFCISRPAEGPIVVEKRFQLPEQGTVMSVAEEPPVPRRIEIDLARTRRQQQVAMVDPTRAIDPSRVSKAISGSIARAFPQRSTAASGYMKLNMEQSSHGGDFNDEVVNADEEEEATRVEDSQTHTNNRDIEVEMTTNIIHSKQPPSPV